MTALPPGNTSWDAVVVGGGPAGAAAAIALARAGRRVLVVERRADVGFKLGESLPPQARPLAEDLLGQRHADEETERAAGRFRTYGNVSCWGRAEPDVHDFVFTPHGYGLRLDRPRFDLDLRRSARRAGAEIAEDTRVEELEVGGSRAPEPWRLVLANAGGKVRVRARVLIDCSGRAAFVARRGGARVLRQSRLFAFARTYEPASGHETDVDTFTRIEARPEGWWYTAGLPDGRRLVVLHTDRDLPAARQAATAAGFEALLAGSLHIAPLLGEHGYRPRGRVRGAVAASQRLDRFTGDAWLAAGDAAQAFDPLSSQGIKTALESGFLAGSIVVRALDGDAGATARYAREQEAVQAEYRRHYGYFYGCERRFADQPFWQRRQRSRIEAVSR